MKNEFDIEDEKEVKKTKRNIKILLVLAIIIIIIPIYIIVRIPFGIFHLSAFGNKIQEIITFSQEDKTEKQRDTTEVKYNPLKSEVQKKINDYLVTYQILKKGAKDTEEINGYDEKIKDIIKLQERLQQTENEADIQNIKVELSTIVYEINKEEINKKYEQEKALTELHRKYNEGVKKLDKSIFLVDVDNYNPESNDIIINEETARKVAQKGFEESAKRIAGEGADNKESETVQIREESPNNYFTRYIYEGDKIYTNKKRNCYVITRENEMGNGISIYVDVTTGMIIGGKAFGD